MRYVVLQGLLLIGGKVILAGRFQNRNNYFFLIGCYGLFLFLKSELTIYISFSKQKVSFLSHVPPPYLNHDGL